MDAYPSNSHRERKSLHDKTEPKKIEKIVESKVVQRKKPLGRRLKETFVGGNAKGVWEYIMLDVLIPAAKDMIADAGSQGLERMIFGESRSSSRRGGYRPGGGNVGHIQYNNRYSPNISRRDEERPTMSRRAQASHDFDEIILGTRAEADEVLDQLFEVISQYEVATVSDLYAMVGIKAPYTSEKWGWSALPGAGVERIRNGYLLNLPKPEPID